jgi:hypothetical protein
MAYFNDLFSDSKLRPFQTLKVILLCVPESVDSKMENRTENVDESMKNSSASTAPASDGLLASGNRELRPLVAAGTTCEGEGSCGIAHGDGDNSDGFTVVRRSKRRLSGAPKKMAPGGSFFPLSPRPCDSAIGTDHGAVTPKLMELGENFVDPFGLSLVSPQDNPVTWARTKQSVRQHTAGSAGTGIRGGFSPRKLAVKAAGPKKVKSPVKARVSLNSEDDGWETRSSDSGSGDEGGRKSPVSRVSPVPDPKTVAIPIPRDVPGRFNGRIHPTGGDGSCGAHALLAALQHLVRTRGLTLVLPEGAEELREVLVEDIRENLDVVGEEFPLSLRSLITDEYLVQVSATGARQHLHNPDLMATTGRSSILVQTVDDYLAIMAMPHTHLDEFMLAAAARIWEVRVAVLERHGTRVTTDHVQFVPRRRVEEDRTVFIVRRGNHFEWAHANSTPCEDEKCASTNKRVSAQHVPFHACVAVNDTPLSHQTRRQGPPGSRPSNGGDAVLKVLVEQLCEEYPDLSPDRADAALRLTKQNGRFNLYAAARVLPGREGVPIVLSSPDTHPGDSAKHVSFSSGKSSTASSSWIDAGSNASNISGDWEDPGSGEDEERRADVTGARFTSPQHDGARALACQHHQATEANAAEHTCCYHDNHARDVPCGRNPSTDPTTSAQSSFVDQAVQFASHTVSLTARCGLKEARSALCKHMTLCGNLTVAAQRACQELVDGAPVDMGAAQDNLPKGGGLRLVEKQFGAEGRTQSVPAMAKRSRENDERMGPHQRHLFDNALTVQMQRAGADLTAGQRLATGIRRTEEHLFREAQIAERATARRLQQQLDQAEEMGDGSTPASAALITGSAQTMRGATQPSAAPTPKPPRAAFHASPSVRVAQQIQLKRELAASNGNGSSAILVVNSAGTKLPTWKAGSEADGKGFNWKTKQKMVHAWEAYQASEGLHAPKSFKSMIDVDLIPSICAECNLEEGDWEVLDDVTLLIAIEEKLKPHDAMDFTVQLKLVAFDHNAQRGSLTQRYRLFAEAFLSKVSEAKAAGFILPENVIKLAFTRALSGNALLQGWLEQEKWVSVAAAHRRITNSLKMVDAYHTLQTMSGDAQPQAQPQQQIAQQGVPQQPAQQQNNQQQPDQQQPAQQQPAHQQNGFQQQVQPVTPAAPTAGQFRRNQRFDARMNLAVQQALAGYQQAIARQQNQALAAQPAAVGSINAGFPAGAERKPLQLPPFPGLDARGLHWHVHSAALGCKTFPCNAPFCQACGIHHHSANECRKRFYNNPGANLSGYWSEQRPNGAPLRNQAPATANVAVQFSNPPFPTPYQMNGNNANPAAASGGAAPVHQPANSQQGNVNYYAARQQQPAAPDSANDGKSL